MKIKAVAFDIDNTLYPDRSLYKAGVWLLMLNLPFILVYRKVRKALRERDYNLKSKLGGFFDEEALVFKEISGSAESLDSIKAKIRKFYKKWLQIFPRARPFPRMKDTLFSLSGKGLKLGFMSDLAIANRLEVLGLSSIVDMSFSSQEVGYLKPHRAAFEHMIAEFGYEPYEILYVGNSYRYDILGAAACGIRTAHITRHPVEGSVADFTFSRYEDLEAYIDNLQ